MGRVKIGKPQKFDIVPSRTKIAYISSLCALQGVGSVAGCRMLSNQPSKRGQATSNHVRPQSLPAWS